MILPADVAALLAATGVNVSALTADQMAAVDQLVQAQAAFDAADRASYVAHTRLQSAIAARRREKGAWDRLTLSQQGPNSYTPVPEPQSHTNAVDATHNAQAAVDAARVTQEAAALAVSVAKKQLIGRPV